MWCRGGVKLKALCVQMFPSGLHPPASEVAPFLNAQLNVENRNLRVATARTGFQKFAGKEETLLMSSSVKWKVRERKQ